MENNFHIEQIPVGELFDFISDFLKHKHPDDVTPLSKLRAISQMNNPYSVHSDIGLFVAYYKKRCIGYLGFLPAKLQIQEKLYKVGFTSSAYVPPKFRSTGAGLKLAFKTYRYKADTIGTDNGPSSEELWRGMSRLRTMSRMKELAPYKILRFCCKPILRNNNLFKPKINQIEIEEVNNLVGEKEIPLTTSRVGFYRGIEAINWMLKYPWIASNSEIDPEENNYLFSNKWALHQFKVVKLYSKAGDYKGFQVFSLITRKSNGEKVLKILDNNLQYRADFQFIFPLACHFANKLGVHFIETSEDLMEFINPLFLALGLSMSRNRSYFVLPAYEKSPLHKALPNLEVNYNDGDTAFT